MIKSKQALTKIFTKGTNKQMLIHRVKVFEAIYLKIQLLEELVEEVIRMQQTITKHLLGHLQVTFNNKQREELED